MSHFIRNIEAGEKCKFCEKVHTSWVQVTSNASAYTSMYNVPFCDEHKADALAFKNRVEAVRYTGNRWD